MLKTNHRMYAVETKWDKSIPHLVGKIDSPSLYHYAARDDIYVIIQSAYMLRRDYCIVGVSNVCKEWWSKI